MELLLERIYTNSNYTIGHLYLIKSDNTKEYLMDTIEDSDRSLNDNMTIEEIKKKKIYCKTAIPTGKYKITMWVKSPSFSKKSYYKNFCDGYLPRLIDVKGFDGILIHRGVDANSSCGCIIVGFNKIKGKVTDSQKAFETLMNDYLLPCKKNNEKIYIKITSKYKK